LKIFRTTWKIITGLCSRALQPWPGERVSTSAAPRPFQGQARV
jgi:hypothetical protein